MRVVYHTSHKTLPAPVPGDFARESRESGLGPALWLLLAMAAGAVAWAATHDDPAARLGLCVDRVTSVIALLVAGIGVIAYRYSERCLDGHARRHEFLGWMAATVGCAVVLAMANALPLLIGAWIGVGACLDRLLRFFRDRPLALATARRTCAIGMLGDLLMCAAFAVAWSAWGATSVTETAAAAAATGTGAALTGFTLLLCAAVIVKSAQVPMHGWLPDTMEAPTPVSALMHAGIVNAGGVLLIRLAPAIERVPEAWLLLSVFGTASILVAAPATWFSARAKTALAWSTVSQMGFMLVQCALCAFPAALLHIVGHGLYKAWSFLRAGEVPRAMPSPAPSATRAIALLMLGTLLSAVSLAAWASAFGLVAGAGPGKLALLAIVAIAVGQCWVALLGQRRASQRATLARVAASTACTAVGPAIACALYAAVTLWLGPAAAGPSRIAGTAAWIAAGLPVAAIALLAAIHAGMPSLEIHRLGARLRIHAMNGFYLGIVANRAIDRINDLVRTTIHGVTRA
jgi:formate hydrogenlyase subunit 3/multisubunit Na+/H+ antiporter MnhD subunit